MGQQNSTWREHVFDLKYFYILYNKTADNKWKFTPTLVTTV